MKNESPDKSLTALLQGWKLDAEPAPRFSEEVWQRIARHEAVAASASWTARWKQWLGGFTRSTDFAWGMAAAVIVTAGAGWMGLRAHTDGLGNTRSPGSYLASVDPYRMNQ